ncbi:YscQ/HrcQ family type III secretion apparatus protein [Paraburkholderia sp. Ac-20340]|uniref:type III secretion system cytoplasmic ring protein SctQ n=1 Tax=Paraburkholderia sp. Ac-20340 TaxID=2703888 RepID=UPI00197E397C|nr:type III secretion system cytoplasmic ring protein SctQ [Paraburkholderia sp. Ac-20340]MBN3853184.1 YscQ/HrcQ family type III secretion apparatus protein [Paraburkholderia sp. Ac-20340]
MDHTRLNSETAPEGRAAVTLAPDRLPALGAAQARLARLAVDERLRALLAHTAGIGDWRAGARTAADLLSARDTAVATLRWAQYEARFALDLAQHPSLASLVAESGDERVQPALRLALCALLFEPLTRTLAQFGIDGVEVLAFERLAPNPAPALAAGCALHWRHDAQRYDAALLHIDSGWLDVFERLVAQQCLPFATHVSELTVPGRLLIGEKTLSLAVLDSLRAGDVVLRALPAELAAHLRGATPEARVRVAWGRYGTRQIRARATLHSTTLTLNEDPVMNHDLQPGAPLSDAIDAPVEIGQLDLPLRFEIDTVSLPVAQLSALRAGYVLELPTAPADARIRLVTCGQTIGFGELVSVGEHLGVRLVQMQNGHGSV